MSEELGFVRFRMLLSSMMDGLLTGNKMVDFYQVKRIIKYSSGFDIRDMGGGVVLIREPSIELITYDDLIGMGFGC